MSLVRRGAVNARCHTASKRCGKQWSACPSAALVLVVATGTLVGSCGRPPLDIERAGALDAAECLQLFDLGEERR